jgi:hypothetical protein
MRLRSHPNRHCLLVLVIFVAFGLNAVATADPMAASKVRTITIRPPSSGESVHTITINPDPNASAPRLLPAPDSDPDRHFVHTIRVPSQSMPELSIDGDRGGVTPLPGELR